ncbi:MAG: HD-GYP domain-containing protein, partial [Vulcanimicrobiota bacterium]
ISLPEKSLIRIINGERVSKEESVIYLTHPSVSIRVFQSHDKFSEIAKIIRGHHERMDGTGFPDRLYGEKIPLESRLIAIADQYDSTYMLNPGFDPERLIDIVKTKVGTYLDPMLFNEFKNEILHGAPLHKIKNVNYEDLEPGMILAMPVKTKGGLKILGAGIILNNEYIQGIEKVAKYGNLCLPIKVYNS